MTVNATASLEGQPLQPINVTVNVTKKKKKDDDYLPGINTYRVIEGILHFGLATRGVAGCTNQCTPVYQSTYLAAAAVGAVFGLYSAMKDKPYDGIANRAKTFAEGELTTKATVVAEQALFMSLALQFAEGKVLDGGLTAGSIVAGYWGFSLGAELAGMAYNSFKSDKE